MEERDARRKLWVRNIARRKIFVPEKAGEHVERLARMIGALYPFRNG